MSENEKKDTPAESPLHSDLENALKDAQDYADHLDQKEEKASSPSTSETQGEEHVADTEQADEHMEEIRSLKAQLAAAQKNANDFKDGMLRARADLENARRRFERNQIEEKKFASEKTLKALIPVVDDLDLALANIGSEQDQNFVEGVKLVQKKFIQALESQGAQTFYPQGDVFDPTLHEAMMEAPSTEVPPGHVLQVFQRGWMLQDRLLRPAKVILAKEA